MRIDCEMHIGQFKGDAYTWLGHDIEAGDLETLMDEYKLDMCVAALEVAGLSAADEAMVMGGSLARLMKLAPK